MGEERLTETAALLKYRKRFETSWADDAPIDAVRFVVLDCETTGLNPTTDRIITIGAVGIESAEIVIRDSFEALLKIASNTFVNDLLSTSSRLLMNRTAAVPSFTNNKIWGLALAQLSNAPMASSGTVLLTSRPSLVTAPLTFINPTVSTTGSTLAAASLSSTSMSLADLSPQSTPSAGSWTTSTTAGIARGNWIPEISTNYAIVGNESGGYS